MIVSTEAHAGKSLLALGLGMSLNEKGDRFSYMKPVSYDVAYKMGESVDRAAHDIREILGLEDDLRDIAPIVLDEPCLREAIQAGDRGFHRRIRDSFDRITHDRQAALIEGRRYLGLGVGAGLSDMDLAESLGAEALIITRYDGPEAIDRILCALRLLDPEVRLLGVVLNNVSMDAEFDLVNDTFVPFLADRGAEVMGIVPYEHRLHYVSIREIVGRLRGQVMNDVSLNKTVGHVMIGAMTPQVTLRGLRRSPDVAMITGGDMVELQLAAIQAPSLSCLILTGNIRPRQEVIIESTKRGIPVVAVGQNAATTAGICQRLFGRSHIYRSDQLNTAMSLIKSNIDIERIMEKATDH